MGRGARLPYLASCQAQIGTLIKRMVILQIFSAATRPQLGNESEEEGLEEGIAASVSDEAVDAALRALEVLAACPEGRAALGLRPGGGGGQRTMPMAGAESARDTLSAALLGLLGVVESSLVGGLREWGHMSGWLWLRAAR